MRRNEGIYEKNYEDFEGQLRKNASRENVKKALSEFVMFIKRG